MTITFTLADALTKRHWGTAEGRRGQSQSIDSLTLQAVRNEYTGFQIHLTADHEYTLVTDRANWLHPLGFLPRVRLAVEFPSLPSDSVEVFPIGWIEGDDRRYWMETLERGGWAEVPAGRPQAVYVRIRVPKDLPPGVHEGKMRTFTQQGFEAETPVWEGEIRLEVSAVTLPDVRNYSFHLNLWQHLTSISRFYRVPLWGKEHFSIIDRYFSSLGALGQKALTLVVSEFPWSGQRCYRDRAYPSYLFEHSTIPVFRGADGSLRCDFSVLDRLIALASAHGIDRQIDLIGLVNIWIDPEYGFGKAAPDAPDAVRVRVYDETTGVFSYLTTADDLRRYIRLLHDHLNDLGVMDRVRVSADEPADLEAFNRSLEFVREAGPDFKFGAAINHFEFLEDAPPGLVDFVPVLPLACKDPALTARLAEEVHVKDGRMLWYICCWPPIPNTFLHSPLPESRLLGWLNYALKMDGFLRWAFCLWPADPWTRVSWRAPDWSAGDMYFVLPGLDGAPVETLRYEALRFAVQDYELLKLAERSLPAEQVDEVFRKASACILHTEKLGDFANVGTLKPEDLYSLDPADYHQARGFVIDAIRNG